MSTKNVASKLSQRVSTVYSYYIKYLGRTPEADGLQSYVSSRDTLNSIEKQIRDSEECRELDASVSRTVAVLEPFSGKQKVLLFGAYGNGNLGDREMATVAAAILERASDVVCFAYSELTTMDYPFPPERRLNRAHNAMNPRVLDLFDALVIGGGGILACPHDPIWTPLWAELVPIPFALLSCGLGSPLDHRIHNLVSGAAVASARDSAGVAELLKLNRAALLCPDLLLVSATPANDGGTLVPKSRGRRLFILRGPFGPWHRALQAELREGDAIGIFEPLLDITIFCNFKNVIIFDTSSHFLDTVKNFDVTISERYHGIIFSLLAGIPSIGIHGADHNAGKIISIFNSLGLSEHCFDRRQNPLNFTSYAMNEVNRQIAEIRREADASYARFTDQLLKAIPFKAPS